MVNISLELRVWGLRVERLWFTDFMNSYEGLEKSNPNNSVEGFVLVGIEDTQALTLNPRNRAA